MINWAPFNYKTSKFITEAINNRIVVAEGSIRAGKTVALCIIASMYLETCPDKYHLVTGSKMGNGKLNVGVSDGYGLEGLFKGRCRWGKYKSNEALYIDTKTGEKIVIFAGGGKSDSYKSILGNSYGMWLATEINQHYDCDNSKESFIKVALGRQIASKQPITLWDMNPEHPKHRIYTEYIDKWKQQDMAGGYLYEHFTIKDNLSISAERKAEIESMYDKGTIWYQRDILGLRVVAEGLIYETFANKPERYLFKDKLPQGQTIIGIDYGGTKSGQAFVCTRIANNYSKVIVLATKKITKLLNDKELLEAQLQFIEYCRQKYQCEIDYIYPDNADPTHIRSLDNEVRLLYPHTVVRGCWKQPINDRIKTMNKMLAFDVFSYMENECDTLVEALETAIWDSSKLEDVRLDNFTSDIDTLDAYEYSFERDIKSIIDKMEGEYA